MPLDLPEPSIDDLGQAAPLQLVVCQLRHERNLAVGDVTRALAIHAQLKGDYTTLDEGQQSQIEIIAGAGDTKPTTSTVEQRGWRLRSADDAWTAALLPDYFALECSGYTTWSDFLTRLDALVHAVAEHLAPAACLRLGLRYIDSINLDSVSAPDQWRGYINQHLLGPLTDDQLAPSISAMQQVVQMKGNDGLEVVLRHGVDSTQNSAYVLDTDCSWPGPSSFNVDEVLDRAKALHRLALQVFQSAVTPELLRRLKGEED